LRSVCGCGWILPLKLKLILHIISYLTYICWEIDNFVIKSDIFRRFFICKNILKKLSYYHDNCSRYFMFGKYNGFVSKARVSARMYFLVINDSTKKCFSLGPLVLSKQTFIYMSHHRTCSQVVFEKAKLQLQTNNICWTRTIDNHALYTTLKYHIFIYYGLAKKQITKIKK
jgi:hypothetical protein